MDLQRAFRLVRLWIGGILVVAWGVACTALLGNYTSSRCVSFEAAACGDLRRGLFVLGVAASPMLLVGMPLFVSGLPRRAADAAGPRPFRRFLQIVCFLMSAIFALCSLAFVADVGSGAGAEFLVVVPGACAAASVWAGARAGR